MVGNAADWLQKAEITLIELKSRLFNSPSRGSESPCLTDDSVTPKRSGPAAFGFIVCGIHIHFHHQIGNMSCRIDAWIDTRTSRAT